MTMFLVLMALISSAAAVTTQDIIVATQEMQKANYFTFVLLINMAPFVSFPENITFLMPNDRALSETSMSETSIVDFLLRQSIPSPLLIDHLKHFPTGSLIPTAKPGFMLNVTNGGRGRFFLNNVRLVSPNICTQGSSIRCHGIDAAVQPATILSTPVVVATSPPYMSPPDGGAAQAPAVIAAPSPSVGEDCPPTSSSPGTGHPVMVDLAITFFIPAFS